MAIYIVIFLLFFVASVLEAGGLKKNQAKWLFVGLAIVLTLFVGLRYNTGGDWVIYKQMFYGTFLNTEYGYLLLNKIFNAIFDNYYVLQFFCTLFFVFAISRLYKIEAPYPIAALTLLMCFMLFNILMSQMRQSLAIAIIILFSNYIFERKFWLFFLGIFIASFFHSSAVTAIPIYFLYRHYNKILLIVLILVAIVFSFYSELLRIMVLEIAPILPEKISMKAIAYMNSIFVQTKAVNTGLLYLFIQAIILLSILIIKIENKKMAFFINSLAIFAIIRALSVPMIILGRLESYYLVFAVIAFTYIWDIKIKQIQLYATKLIFSTVLLLFFFALPIREITSTQISLINKRPNNDAKIPYYNCIFYPQKATERKDWNQ